MHCLSLISPLLLTLFVAAVSHAATLPLYHTVVGESVRHVVKSGDSLAKLAPKYGMKPALAAKVNVPADPHRLKIGQTLRFSNQRIVPAKLDDGIVIDIVVRTLFWFKAKELIAQFPVAVGKADWATPPGKFNIISRRRKPTWHVPPAIQAEMREKGEEVKTKVPPGPDNPLGDYWLQLSGGDYGLHGTNAPWTVGRYATHGCMRLRPQDIERLFNEAPNGTPVWVIYEPVKLAELPDGHLVMEVHDDIYERTGDIAEHLAERLQSIGLSDRVDVARAQQVIKDAWGIAMDVTSATAATPSPTAVVAPEAAQ